MNPDKTIEYNSLSWVKAQLDDVLSDAQSNLNDYIENKVKEDLENCLEHLQLIHGTLQMVEVYGGSMLAEEMQHTTQAILDGTVESDNDAYDVLMRAMLQLPDYLEGIQAGKHDAPITLMPLINDLRAARNVGLLTEGVLFSPVIENIELDSNDYNSAAIESGKLQEEVKRLRTHYQLGLLDFIRNNKEQAGLKRIKAVLKSLEKITSNSEVRHIWMIAGALVEGLLDEGIENNLSVKKLLAAVDRQFRMILDLGEAEFANQYSKELVTNILYYIGLSTIDNESVTAIKVAYNLSEYLPQENSDNDSAAIAGLNADLFDTVSKGITEDIGHVKDVLELYMHSSDKDTEQLVPVVDQLGKIGDTFGMLGMGATRQAIIEQRATLDKVVSGDVTIDEQLVMGIASELLGAESELKNFIDERSGFIDMNRHSDDNAVPAAEYRQVVFSVVSEALKNFSEAKEAVLSYTCADVDTASENSDQLDIILNRIEEVRGVAMMLPLGRVERQIEKLQDFVRIALQENQHQTSADEQDTVADVVTSIEYFLEALSEGRPGVEQGLNAGDIAADKLEYITRSYGGHESADTVEQNEVSELESPELDPNEADHEIDIDLESADEAVEVVAVVESDLTADVTDLIEPEVSESDSVDTEILDTSVVEDTKAEATADEQYEILADDADEEIVEIFIEEAVEVLGELHESLPQWKNNAEDSEALGTVRRCFHTLKGSGRLLGAEMIGEFSWKFENMLNRVIENKVNTSDSLFLALDEALAVIPQLIEQLKGNREPIENITQLMSVADALAEGQDVSFDPAIDTNTESPEATVEPDIESHNDLIEENETDVSIELTEEADDSFVTPADSDVSIQSDNEIINFDDIADDVTISDSSDSDISELDPENNITMEAVEFDSGDKSVESEDDALLATASNVIDINIGETANSNDVTDGSSFTEDEIVVPDSEEVVEDHFSAELDELDVDNLDMAEAEAEDSLEEITLEVAENAETIDVSDIKVNSATEDNELELDPMLLKIYHDESISHIEAIREQFAQAESEDRPISVCKDLMRAFHTLFGSARTAEVEPIAELTGTAEKYIKAREDSGTNEIPSEAVEVLREIEKAVTSMLEKVAEGKLPDRNIELHEKINAVFQQEVQDQLQKPWQGADEQSDSTDENQEVDNETNASATDFEIEKHKLEAASDDDTDKGADEVEDGMAAPDSDDTRVEISYGDIDEELIDIFLEEADELLEDCEQVVGHIKNEPNSTEHIHKLQRNMHTLKGGARMADLTPVGDLTHNLESLVVMVNENKLFVDKALLDLLQESLDVLTTMLGVVRKRDTYITVGDLNERIEMMMRGEIKEKRSVERFDVDMSDLESVDEEELEEIDVTALLEPKDDQPGAENKTEISDDIGDIEIEQAEHQPSNENRKRGASDKLGDTVVDGVVESNKDKDEKVTKEGRPHWGERATDVNFRESQELVRVRSDLLNNLVDYAGEVNIYHARMSKQVSDYGFNLSELTQTVIRLKEQLRKLEIETEIQIRSGHEKETSEHDDDFDPLEMDQYSTLHQLTRSLGETAGDVDSINEILTEITRDTETLLVQESRISTDLQEGLMRTRMVRFGGLSSRLRRIVRQVSRELGKEVELRIDGESSEVDRTVLDRIIAPLEHILRNAVAHGIEMPDQRRASSKNETGVINIDVKRQGADVVIDIADDGAGIDVHKIREKAVKQGLMSVDSEISDHDALQFILHSGFSTADEVTQVSGRGVGMDVVDSEIKQLGGVLDIDTEPGNGSRFRVRLPLTLAINQALLVNAADEVFAIPLASIEGVVRVTGTELQNFYESENSFYEFNGVEYELKHLGGLLTGHQASYEKQFQLFPVLLVQVGDQHFALHVEDLIGRREIVVKPVGLQIGSVHGIAGATILADGRVVLILEMSALVVADSLFGAHAIEEEQAAVEVEDDVKTIMVVDDSITIRKITERMLKRYGVNVILAKDGVDATNQLQDTVPDMMLLDIEMPRMDGFEVASYVRNDERLKDIPIIMITSRTGSKHKEKAMEIGVNQYLGKPFQEEDLMQNINDILNTSY